MTETLSGFVRACAVTDIPDTNVLAVRVGEVALAVVRSEGAYYALHDACSHAEVAAVRGRGLRRYDGLLAARLGFDLRTGRPLCPPATEPVPVYATKVDGDDRLRQRRPPHRAGVLTP